MSNSATAFVNRDSTRIRELCSHVLAFFREQRSLSPNQRRGYCRTLENGDLQTERILGCGITLTLTSVNPKTASLRIGLEPNKFRLWMQSIGEVQLFYTDPFGIEIMLRDGVWGAFVGPHRLPFDLTRQEYHEIGTLEIQNGGAYLVKPKENATWIPAADPTLRVSNFSPPVLNGDPLNSPRVLPDSPSAPDPSGDPSGSAGTDSAAHRLLRILEQAD